MSHVGLVCMCVCVHACVIVYLHVCVRMCVQPPETVAGWWGTFIGLTWAHLGTCLCPSDGFLGRKPQGNSGCLVITAHQRNSHQFCLPL